MNRTLAFSSILFGAALSVTVGCSSSDNVGSDSSNVESASAATTCARYSEAKPHYQKAVRGAEDRLAGKYCDDGTFLEEIASEATTAVMICPELKSTIKNDSAAKPIRDVLADSLTLHSLTGELLVLRDSELQDWSGVEELLVGKTFQTEPDGGFGQYTGFKLGADGKATYITTELLDQEPWVTRPESPATYTVQRTGDARAPRKVIITYAGQTVEFDLRVIPSSDDTAPAVFQLVPPGQDPSELWKTFNSIVGECSA